MKSTKQLFIIRNLILVTFILFLIINFIFDFSFINDQFDKRGKEFISNYIVPHKNISELEVTIKDLKKERNMFESQKNLFENAYIDLHEDSVELEYNSLILEKILLQFDPYEFDMNLKKEDSKLEYSYNSSHSFKKNGVEVKIFSPTKNIFLYGISNKYPGSGYLEIYNNKLILTTASGLIAFSNSSVDKFTNDVSFEQIKTNINEFINEEQFKKSRIHDFDWLEGGWFSVKDVQIFGENIYLSYTREVKEDCWNTSLVHGKMNYNYIHFENLFTSKECVHFYDNIDEEFNAHQSGGRIISLDEKTVFFSIGDFRSRYRTQKEDSIFGKVLKINKTNKEYKVISMGHRNPQGLYYNKKENFLLEAEHGPEGGDEINLVQLDQDFIQNFGWAISSYGEHYGGKFASFNKKKYTKYPLHKSHSEYGFIEPLKYFNPSIGISQIVGLEKENNYVVASMKDQSLYFFEYNNNILDKNEQKIDINKNKNIERLHIGERIRDMIIYKDKLYLFLEDSASFAEITFK